MEHWNLRTMTILRIIWMLSLGLASVTITDMDEEYHIPGILE